jgi:hypothetical protein
MRAMHWAVGIAISCAGLGGCTDAPLPGCNVGIVALWIPDPRDAGTTPWDGGPECSRLQGGFYPDAGTVLGSDECVRFCGAKSEALRECHQKPCREFAGRRRNYIGCFNHFYCL